MNTKITSGLFMLTFLVCAVPLAVGGTRHANARMEAFHLDPFLKGNWALAYEKAFNKTVAIYEPSINLWGLLNYALFREGSDGVLIGKDGWLFTREEFDFYPEAEKEIQKKIGYIAQVRDRLAEKNINLVIVPVPAKARVYDYELGRYHLPSYKKEVYANFIALLRARHFIVADVLPEMTMRRNSKQLYLKSDTHWTPSGAELAANVVAAQVAKDLPKMKYNKSEFVTRSTGAIEHSGDLMRYVPLGPTAQFFGFEPDQIQSFETSVNDNKSATLQEASLFSDEKIPVTLVGTSYSANPEWNFEGFLKQSLKANILNAADEGMGPFETMKKYLNDESFITNPPELVVWEIPERYLPVPYNLNIEQTAAKSPDLNI